MDSRKGFKINNRKTHLLSATRGRSNGVTWEDTAHKEEKSAEI